MDTSSLLEFSILLLSNLSNGFLYRAGGRKQFSGWISEAENLKNHFAQKKHNRFYYLHVQMYLPGINIIMLVSSTKTFILFMSGSAREKTLCTLWWESKWRIFQVNRMVKVLTDKNSSGAKRFLAWPVFFYCCSSEHWTVGIAVL